MKMKIILAFGRARRSERPEDQFVRRSGRILSRRLADDVGGQHGLLCYFLQNRPEGQPYHDGHEHTFLAPCLTGATAKARIIKFGRTLISVAVDLFDDAGVRVAVAQVTYFVFRS